MAFAFPFLGLKNKLHLREQRIQRFLWIDHIRLAEVFDARRAVARGVGEYVAEAAPCLQSRSPERERKVIDQKRPVRYA